MSAGIPDKALNEAVFCCRLLAKSGRVSKAAGFEGCVAGFAGAAGVAAAACGAEAGCRPFASQRLREIN